MKAECGTCRCWQAEVVDSMTGRAMPDVFVANCKVHLKDTERDDWCRCHSDCCTEAEALERRALEQNWGKLTGDDE